MRIKRGGLSTLETVGGLVVIAVLVGFVIILFIKQPGALAHKVSSDLLIKSAYEACRLKGENNPSLLINNDIDKDKLPDDCDNCVRRKGLSKNDPDIDKDYTPDSCFEENSFTCKKIPGINWIKRHRPFRCIEEGVTTAK